MSLFYGWLECGNVWDDDLERNTQSFVLVCVSILCICKLEDGVKRSAFFMYI